jgi:hypothetical protein
MDIFYLKFQDFSSKKDRRGLLVYKSMLQKQTESYFYADTILKSPVSINYFISHDFQYIWYFMPMKFSCLFMNQNFGVIT